MAPINFFGKGQSKDPDPRKSSRRSDVLKQLGEKTKDDYPDRPTTQIRIGQTLRNLPEKHTYLRTYEYLCDPNFLPFLWVLIADLNNLSTGMDDDGNPLAQLKRGQVIYLPTPEEIMDFDPNEFGIGVDATEGFREQLEDEYGTQAPDDEDDESEIDDEDESPPPTKSRSQKQKKQEVAPAAASKTVAQGESASDEQYYEEEDDEGDDDDDDDEENEDSEDQSNVEASVDDETTFLRGPVPKRNQEVKTKLIPDELVPPKRSENEKRPPIVKPPVGANPTVQVPSVQGPIPSSQHPSVRDQSTIQDNPQTQGRPSEQANPYAQFGNSENRSANEKIGWMRDYEKQLRPSEQENEKAPQAGSTRQVGPIQQGSPISRETPPQIVPGPQAPLAAREPQPPQTTPTQQAHAVPRETPILPANPTPQSTATPQQSPKPQTSSGAPQYTDPLQRPTTSAPAEKFSGPVVPEAFSTYKMRGLDLRQVVPGGAGWRDEYTHLDLAANARIRTYISDSEDDFAIVLEKIGRDSIQPVAAYEFHNDVIRLVKQTLAVGQQISRINLIRAVAVKLAANDLSRNWNNYFLM
jgi:hypothetical protein